MKFILTVIGLLLLIACGSKGSDSGTDSPASPTPNPTPSVNHYCYEDVSCQSACFSVYPFKTHDEAKAECIRRGLLLTDQSCLDVFNQNLAIQGRFDSCIARRI